MSFDYNDEFDFNEISLDNLELDIDNFDEDEVKERKPMSKAARARRDAARAKARKKKLFARRVTIVGFLVLFVCLVVTALWVSISWIAGSIGSDDEPTTFTAPPTEAPTTITFNAPSIEDDKEVKGKYSTSDSSVYIYNNAAMKTFSGDDTTAIKYAETISQFKETMGEDVTVYSMVVPSHIEFSVPQRLVKDGEVTTASQTDFIRTVYETYEDVIPINCYNKLSEHCKEYIYFNTDHYWTALGAYYGYQAFCEETDQKKLDIEVCTKNTVAGYEGPYLYYDESLATDTVEYWTFPYDSYAMRTEANGGTPYQTSIFYGGATAGIYTYGLFLWNDCPLFVEYNEQLTNGKKIVVVKDTFANPFASYLTANYEQVHIIDYRRYTGSLQKYCLDNEIDEVLFINDVHSASDTDHHAAIKTLY